MSKDWTYTTLGDIADFINAKVNVSDLTEANYISTENMLPNFEGVELASSLPSTSSTRSFRKNDILFSNIRTYFKKVWLANFNGGCSNDVLVFRGRKEIEPTFLYYLLTDDRFTQYTVKTAKGTKMPRGDKKAISLFEFKLPPLPEQKIISHILRTLDDKIELNRKMNETLEQMAQALFKSWFVDFDPVIDNAIAKGNELPAELNARIEKRKEVINSGKYKPLPKDIMELFPASFEYNEVLDGWIPEGWGVKCLYSCAKFINGAAFKSPDFSNAEKALPVIKIAELKNGITSQTKFTLKMLDEKYLVQPGDLLYSWSGSPDTSLDAFIWVKEDGWLNQHIFKVNTENMEQRSFCYFQLKHLKPVLIAIAKDKQTTGLGHITIKDMKNLNVIVPSKFENLVNCSIMSFFNKIVCNLKKTEVLVDQRNTLLPKLISGKLRVGEIVEGDEV